MPSSNNGATVEDTLIKICKKVTNQNGQLNTQEPLSRILRLNKYPANWISFGREFKREFKSDLNDTIIHPDMTIAGIQMLFDFQNK